MREIKFRAWDFENEEMIPCDALAFEHYAPLTELLSVEGIMQYTGLIDQHGNEVFEGDIVKRYFAIGRDIYDPVSLGFVDHEIDDEGYFIGVVSYRPSEGFVLNQCKKYDIDYNLISKRSGIKIHAQYAEVIGNIYENPELLGGEQHGQTRK